MPRKVEPHSFFHVWTVITDGQMSGTDFDTEKAAVKFAKSLAAKSHPGQVYLIWENVDGGKKIAHRWVGGVKTV